MARGSAMVPLDKAMTSSYRLLIVTMTLSAAVWPQFSTFKFVPAAIMNVWRLLTPRCANGTVLKQLAAGRLVCGRPSLDRVGLILVPT